MSASVSFYWQILVFWHCFLIICSLLTNPTRGGLRPHFSGVFTSFSPYVGLTPRWEITVTWRSHIGVPSEPNGSDGVEKTAGRWFHISCWKIVKGHEGPSYWDFTYKPDSMKGSVFLDFTQHNLCNETVGNGQKKNTGRAQRTNRAQPFDHKKYNVQSLRSLDRWGNSMRGVWGDRETHND